MYFFLSIFAICLLLAFGGDILKLVHKTEEDKLNAACAKLDSLLKNSEPTAQSLPPTMSDEAKLYFDRVSELLKSSAVEWFIGDCVIALLYLILFMISVRYYYVPVLIFDERFNLQPIDGLISFPTGVKNGVSVPMWVLSCYVTLMPISKALKKRNTKASISSQVQRCIDYDKCTKTDVSVQK